MLVIIHKGCHILFFGEALACAFTSLSQEGEECARISMIVVVEEDEDGEEEDEDDDEEEEDDEDDNGDTAVCCFCARNFRLFGFPTCLFCMFCTSSASSSSLVLPGLSFLSR